MNSYVQGGGGLWLIHNHSTTTTGINSVATQFGVTFNNDIVEDPTNRNNFISGQPIISVFAAHPITQGITSYGQYGGSSLNASVPAMVIASGDNDANSTVYPAGTFPPVLAAAQVGSGRVVFGADNSIFKPDKYTLLDNLQLLSNITDWLAADTVNVVCGLPPGMVAAGWTLVGWACDATGDPAAIATGLGGTVRIYGYNPAVPANPWKIYDSAAPPFVNTLVELTKWNGYWIFYEPSITDVDFEDDPQVGSNITGNQDHHDWLKSKGIDITGTPSGFVWTTEISGLAGVTGVVVGFASPNFLEADSGLSDVEVLTIDFLGGPIKSAKITLTTVPSTVASVNNVPATVTIKALDAGNGVIATNTETFTGVTNGVLTPGVIGISATGIARITLEASPHPAGGVYIEAVAFEQ